MATSANKRPNSLINETSPYLLQHAHNPVNWLPFSEKAFDMAKQQNKPLLVSIGYSACHWCHVMERESFEDPEVADMMNRHFINVKVDREERSDVDMLYMQAVQLMTGHGGWPLNCFVLPDGRPFYGGTYFRKEQWLNILQNLATVYHNDHNKVEEYASRLIQGIKQSELITTTVKEQLMVDRDFIDAMVKKWEQRFDTEEGGPNRAPKFPLPNNYLFLLRYAKLSGDAQVESHAHLTLKKVAFGGIYDQLHGGFARYSTDMIWKVPHFEKMLYDNAQLVSLYCEAHTYAQNELYREVALQTLDFVRTEWYNEEGYFYSAYDADSDGEEGKYYVWSREDLEDLLGVDYTLFSKYYEINDRGYWEQGNYILMRSGREALLQMEHNITPDELNEVIGRCKKRLWQESLSRIKPGLDDKCITAWNAMMCSAYARAYLAFGRPEDKAMALANIQFMDRVLSDKDGRMKRTYKNGTARLDAFLDDYAFTASAFMDIYLITQNERYLKKAETCCSYALSNFSNPESELLYYTHNGEKQLAARTSEISDNVTPASNSQMALNLFYLSRYLGKPDWELKAKKMLAVVLPEMHAYGAGYSNWACLALHLVFPFREIAIVGNHVDEFMIKLYRHGITNAILAASASDSDLPLVKNRFAENKTLIYVCENNTCKLAVNNVEEAFEQLV